MIGLQYAWKRSGPMSMAPSQLGAFTRSSPERAHPNLEYHVQPLSLDAFGEPLHRFDAFTASVCNLNPTSRGHVRIRSADPATPPRIAPDYLATDEDRHIAAESLRVTRRIVAQPALAPFKPQRDQARACSSRATPTWRRSPATSARRSSIRSARRRWGRPTDPMAVVDARLRVHGVAGLRVVDASVMPTITSGNTNAPTLMIAERAAEWILQRRGVTPRARHTRSLDGRTRDRDESPCRSESPPRCRRTRHRRRMGPGQHRDQRVAHRAGRSPTSRRSSPRCSAATTCSRSFRRRTA